MLQLNQVSICLTLGKLNDVFLGKERERGMHDSGYFVHILSMSIRPGVDSRRRP